LIFANRGDLEDILYSLDTIEWNKGACKILNVLGCNIFSTKEHEKWDIYDFLFNIINIYDYSILDKRYYLDKVKSISRISTKESRGKLQCYAIDLNTDFKDRNEIVSEITYVLYQVVDNEPILIFRDDYSFTFSGIVINNESNNVEVIISEWFHYKMPERKYQQLEEVDFTWNYIDYIYSIARPYVKYKESKLLLKYYCIGNKVLDYDFKMVQVEEMYEAAKNYYKEIYGYDYFESYLELSPKDESEDEELMWSLLEMELDSVDSDEYDFIEEDEDKDDEYYGHIDDELLKDYDPETMLKAIRKGTSASI
jgi:hypothetical protein